jgi:hypothetical protein
LPEENSALFNTMMLKKLAAAHITPSVGKKQPQNGTKREKGRQNPVIQLSDFG